MRVATYWHRAEVTDNSQGLEWTRSAWGWSDESPDDARRLAEERAQVAVRRFMDADPFGEDPTDWYAYDTRVRPELIVETVPGSDGTLAGAVKVNRYGATVLNTARLPMIDIDLPQPERGPQPTKGKKPGRPNAPGDGRPTGGLGGMIKRLLGLSGAKKYEGHQLPPDWHTGSSKDSGHNSGAGGASTTEPDDPMQDRLQRCARWAAAHPNAGVRVYRTAAGLRVILVNAPMDPESDEAAREMDAFKCDVMYRRLCKAQASFRARLTPKPWRVGLPGRKITYRNLTSDDPEVSGGVKSYMSWYENESRGYAVCRLLATHGNAEPTDPIERRLIEMHDSATIGDPSLPLA